MHFRSLQIEVASGHATMYMLETESWSSGKAISPVPEIPDLINLVIDIF